jgi:hypothetical protein
MRRRYADSRAAMRASVGLARLPLAHLLAIALVLGQHGMASGPNPSLNPSGLSPPSPGRPRSSSGPDSAGLLPHLHRKSSPSATPNQQQPSSSPDNSPSPSGRFRGPGQGILVPDMYATLNEGFHAARSPDVCPTRALAHAPHSVLGQTQTDRHRQTVPHAGGWGTQTRRLRTQTLYVHPHRVCPYRLCPTYTSLSLSLSLSVLPKLSLSVFLSGYTYRRTDAVGRAACELAHTHAYTNIEREGDAQTLHPTRGTAHGALCSFCFCFYFYYFYYYHLFVYILLLVRR